MDISMNTSNAAYSSKYDPLSSYNWSIIFTWPLFCLFFCEYNIKVLLRGLYNSDCPLNKLKMDKDGNLRNFSPILENIWEYVTNRNRDWQVLLKDYESLPHGFTYTGVHRWPSWWYEQALYLKLSLSNVCNICSRIKISIPPIIYFDSMKIHALV